MDKTELYLYNSFMNERELEKYFKALANQRRLAIVKYLKRKKEASVGGIAKEIQISLRATSKHLSILFSVDLVEKEQRSLQIFYSLSANQKSIVKTILSII